MWWPWSRPPCVLRRVTVSLTGDPNVALEGVLWQTRGGWYVLKDGAMLAKGGPPEKVVGDLIVHHTQVLFFQAD